MLSGKKMHSIKEQSWCSYILKGKDCEKGQVYKQNNVLAKICISNIEKKHTQIEWKNKLI